jgi:hypothetical protein
MRRYLGPILLIVGLIHILLFAVLFADRYAAMARDGLVNTVEGDDKREAAFWTMGFGLLLLTVGSLLQAVQNRTGAVPALTGWLLLALGLGGGVLMPVSPFWLFAPLGLAILRQRRASTDPSAAPLPVPPVTATAGHRGAAS